MFEDMLKTPENHAFTGVGPFERGIPIEQRNARLQALAEVIHARGLVWAAIALIAVQAQHDEKSHEGLLVTLNNQPEEDRKAILDAYAARG